VIRLLLPLVLAVLVCAAEPAGELLAQALAAARSGDLAAARRALEDGRRRFPADPRFPRELAGVAYREKDSPAARRYLHAALHQDPADAYSNQFLASLYLLDDNLAAALKYWNRTGKPLLAGVRLSPEPDLDPLSRARALAASPGQMLTPARLEATETNLRALGLCTQCTFRGALRDDGRLDLLIVTPPRRPLRGWLGRLVSVGRGLPYREIHLDGPHIASQWRWDPEKRRVALDVSAPLGDWRLHWLVDARDERWTIPAGPSALHLRKLETGADLSRNLTTRLRWTTGLRFSVREFRGGETGPAFSGGWSAEIRNRFDYALYRWPERRLRLDSWAEAGTGQVLTGYRSRLVSPEAGLRARWLPQARGERYVVNADLRAGALIGKPPVDRWFLLGMERDNDLWLRGHVGTRDGRKGNAPMGTRFILARSELDRRLFRFPFASLSAGPFFDAGRVAGPYGSRGWLYDTGLQAKVATLAGITVTAVYGRSLRDGRGAFYTAVSR
jgi:hypothetical protein